jgi:cell division protein FtsQ
MNDGAANSESLVRRVLGWIPHAVKIALAVGFGVLVFAGYRAAASASFFQIRSIDVSGTSRTSPDEVKTVVRRFSASDGVWRADLDQICAEVRKLTWVRTAVVSRVLPDGLRVRITEREPRAVVRESSGRFIWVDEDAASLGDVEPNDQMPSFFMRGWDEAPTANARSDNRERVRKYLEMVHDFSVAGLADRVSEVDVNDLRDVRAHLSGADSAIEIRLGSEEFATRLKRGLKVLDEDRSTPRFPFIRYLDIAEGRVTVGFEKGATQIAFAGQTGLTAVGGNTKPTSGTTGAAVRVGGPVAPKRQGADAAKDERPAKTRKEAQR